VRIFVSGNFVPEQPQIKIADAQPPDRGHFSFALTVTAAAVVIVLAGLYLWPGRQSPLRGTPAEVHLSFGPAEQAYAPKIHIENVALSRAENFLHQEVTTLSGELVNTGDQRLRAVEVTIEFSDELNQVVLRESRVILAPGAPPLAPGERRSFEVSFEHIPSSWNMRQPAVFVTGVSFNR
jgi:hypothetical protein